MSGYHVALGAFGVAVMSAAVLPRVARRTPVSAPMLFVVLGMGLFALPLGLDGPQPASDEQAGWAERTTELVVIVSLMSAGLKLRRPVGWRSWSSTWRLLAVAMPLTIAGLAALGAGVLGLPVATALLLGAVLAPTDPVLASEVQLGGPGEQARDPEVPDEAVERGTVAVEDVDDEVRFALTSEAGLNDGLAFPFTNLAIAMAAGGSWLSGWLVHDVAVKLSVGLVAGLVLGRLMATLAFRTPDRWRLAHTGEGFVSLGATLIVYSVTEVAHGYGFLAVFVAAVVLRQSELGHEYHETLHDFAETLEQLASVAFLLLLGGAVVDGALGALTWSGLAVAVIAVAVIRPAAGWLSLLGSGPDRRERSAIAFFGIRGMGSVYYLAYAVTEERFEQAPLIWAVVVTAILISILVHGIAAHYALG